MKRTIRRRTEILIETYEITTQQTAEPESTEFPPDDIRVKAPDAQPLGFVGRAMMKMKNNLKTETAE
jgi:hypothetical protein